MQAIKKPVSKKGGVPRTRVSRWRAAALITVNVLIVAHIIQWRLTGYTVSPVEPAEAMYTLQRGAINAGVIFFSLAILTTLVLGRFFCGWACHMVALQDFCGWLLSKIGMKPKPFRSRLLIYVPFLVAFYMFVWPLAVRFFTKPPTERLIPEFSNQLMTTEFWASFPPVGVAIPFLFICGFMTVWFLGSKGFCAYACPYGGVYRLADTLSPMKIRVTPACDQCGLCTAVCTSHVRVHTEVDQFGMVVDPNCHRAMDCVDVCPQDALYFGFGKPTIAIKGRKSLKKSYTLTWPEEILGVCVFILSLLAVWDVYHLVPMFMAVGTALVTVYLTLTLLRLIEFPDMSFYRFSLRSAGKFKIAGFVFLIFAVSWIGLNIHSGWVHFNERTGAGAFEKITVPDELVLAQADPAQWLTPLDRENITKGKQRFDRAAAAALFVNDESLTKRAWLEYLSGNTERAVELLGYAATRVSGRAKALSLYYRGSILNRLGRYDEALADLDSAIAERPDLVLARVEKGESLWLLGRQKEGLQEWAAAVNDDPRSVLARLMLTGASESFGDMQTALANERAAERVIPDDPYFHWMLGLRLQNVGMDDLAKKHFRRSIQLDPQFRFRRTTADKSI
ncbi:MAG: 4Fe-4S binding protein [Acidobacteria bacterium]|nr:4Fe-4S binding protein [Acidobacteriota bacterium]